MDNKPPPHQQKHANINTMQKSYWVYILTNKSGTLYIGVTNNLEARIYSHKRKLSDGFTSRYNINKLVYYEETDDIAAAIAREKQLKGWTRKKKITLIKTLNPKWLDLAEDW